MLTTTALAAAGFGQSPSLVNLGGLFQRASIITGFAWLTPCPPKRSSERHVPQHYAPGRLSVPRPPEMRQMRTFAPRITMYEYTEHAIIQ
jgi:hypothetical protein